MKNKRLKRFLVRFTIFCLVIFVSLFTWANWSPLSPGEKAKPVQFAQFDISHVKDSLQVVKIKNDLIHLDGVTAAAFNLQSNILSVGYEVETTTCEQLQQKIKVMDHIQLNQKKFMADGPKCPMSGTLSAMSDLRKSLNIRN